MDNNKANSYHDLVEDCNLVEDDGGRKRKRDAFDVSPHQQHEGHEMNQIMQPTAALGGENRVRDVEIEKYREKILKLESHNRELHKILEHRSDEVNSRDREIETLKEELEREKQMRLAAVDEIRNSRHVAMPNGARSSTLAGNGVENERGTRAELKASDESTDEEIQLSSNSSLDQHHYKQVNDLRPLSSGKTNVATQSELDQRSDGGDKRKEAGGENADEQEAVEFTEDRRHWEDVYGDNFSEEQQPRVQNGSASDSDNDMVADVSEEVNADPMGNAVYKAEHEEDSDGSREYAFCCQNCTCDATNEKHYSCANSTPQNSATCDSAYGNFNLFHRGCCHNERGDENFFKSPMQVSREKGFSGIQKEHAKPCSLETIKKKYARAERNVTEEANEEWLAANGSKAYSCPMYVAHCQSFQSRKGTQTSPLRVLELFSGIGSGTLALKKLGIPLDTIVHCDHDPIANEVCKFNHQGDGIKHVYVETFEEIYGEEDEPEEEKVASLVREYGPFDLVLAGAPCSNYSGLNARKDPSCANAQYLWKVGRLIAKLNDVQRREHDMKHEVLFLSENVVFKDHEEINACYGDLEPIPLDAKHFSPCRRNRFYWCNIPVASDEKYSNVASQVSADYDGILDPGCGLVERLVKGNDGDHLPVKANTFLAALTRIDDDRMLKLSSRDSTLKLEHYSVSEREKMMGFSPGYVSKPLEMIFNEITMNAIFRPETSSEGKSYKDFLDEQFWYLGKKLKLRHHPKFGDEPYFEISIATPIESKQQLAFFKEEEYSKRLIGMGFSVCVIEYLLEGIVDLFATKDVLRSYEGCDYSYGWEPYLTYHRDRQMKEA